MIPITVARGDGIGPEIMEATLGILKAAGAPLEIHEVEIGAKVYLKGYPTGIEEKTWETLRHTEAFLKAPITTPQGGGFKSLNVTIRTALGLYANVRPCIAYAPFVATKHPKMNVVIVRENEEDLYSGIEYRLTPEVSESLKLITQPGSDKIIRYAFEYARQHGRKKVACFVKDNIMKLSDGLFHKRFESISHEYPEVEPEVWIVDIGAAKFADTPELFDVIVMPNLYGDILSDIGAQISGSIGLVGSANIGDHGAMFEAVHGSAPRRAGLNLANPSALLLASIMMLNHLGKSEVAQTIHHGWLKTLEDGIHTYDIYHESLSNQRVGTKEFAKAIIKRLGEVPHQLKPAGCDARKMIIPSYRPEKESGKRALVGFDLYIYFDGSFDSLQKKLLSICFGSYQIELITNRGARLYPNGLPETFCVDQWRLRLRPDDKVALPTDLIELLQALHSKGFEVVKTVQLYDYDGNPGYSSPNG